MTDTIRFILTAALIGSGLVCIFFAILGVFKFRFVMNRMHCAAIIDTLGVAFVVAGLLVSGVGMEYIPKLACILLILWVGSPIASHLVGRLEITTDEDLKQHMEMEGGADRDADGIS